MPEIQDNKDRMNQKGGYLKRAMSLRLVAPLLIVVSVTAVLLATSNVWEPLELKAYDLRVQMLERLNIKRNAYTGSVIVVGMIEDQMITRKPLIFWYPEIGEFLGMMLEYEARLVSMDLIPLHSLGEKLVESASSIMEDDLDEDSEVFLEELGETTDNAFLGPLIMISNELPVVQGMAGGTVPYYFPMMAFMENVHKASVKLSPDTDGRIRRQALVDDEEITSFAYKSYLLATGNQLDKPDVMLNYSILKHVPLYSFTDLLDGKYDEGLFKDKIVLLGYITEYEDVHSTPLGFRVSGVMIHAVAIETLLGGTEITHVAGWMEVLVVAAFAFIGLAVSIRNKPMTALGISTFAIAVYLVLNEYLFYKGMMLNVFPNIFTPLLVFGAIYPYRYIVEEGSKRKLYRTFSYFIDRKIIDSLIDKDFDTLMRGESKRIAIMFIDIRGFTELSAECSAKNVVGFLNLYFSSLTEIIQRNNGIVDKFIGDAVLAFFASGDNPVDDALKASREILHEVQLINEKGDLSETLGSWRLKIGVGLHFGSVIMGNIGSKKKMDFTIIGEAVNIASRIEGMTKRFDFPVLATNQIREMSGKSYTFKHLGLHQVRGIKEKVDIYAAML